MSSALPKAVQKQIDESNAIIDLVYPKVELDEAGNLIEPPVEPAPVEPVVVAVEPAPAPAPAEPVVVVEPEPAPAEPVVEDTAEHRYRVLQGKYNAEVPKLIRELREAKSTIGDQQQRITNTESLLASLQHVRTAPVEPEAPVVDAPVITPEETAQFGPDLEDYIERVAARRIMPEIDARLAPVSDRVTGVEQSASLAAHDVAVSERDKVMLALAKAVPDWETQNENEDFLKWLNENDPYAGVPRGQLLTHAFQAHDSVRVIAFFRGFQTENAVVAPEPPVTPLEPPVEPQQKLDDLVAPGTPKTGTTSAPNESGKRVWTQQEISTFFAKKNEFIRKGKPVPEEYDLVERDIFAAQHEGRIR